jgi:chromosome condensin MukBEF complex kleisin-like MukF subunit
MGLWTFAAHRVVDIFVPGAGLIMDAMDAIELIEASLISRHEIVISNVLQPIDTCKVFVRSVHLFIRATLHLPSARVQPN